jgi:hypothetical protein
MRYYRAKITRKPPPMHRRDLLTRSLAALSTLPMAMCRAAAQSKYPERPIRLVIPFPPGGVYDAVGRPWADRVKSSLGTVVVENQDGYAIPDIRCNRLQWPATQVILVLSMQVMAFRCRQEHPSSCTFTYRYTDWDFRYAAGCATNTGECGGSDAGSAN